MRELRAPKLRSRRRPRKAWQPQPGNPGDLYFYVTGTGHVEGTFHFDTEADRQRIAVGNYYRTEKQAQATAEFGE
jgi:hypothetical protein